MEISARLPEREAGKVDGLHVRPRVKRHISTTSTLAAETLAGIRQNDDISMGSESEGEKAENNRGTQNVARSASRSHPAFSDPAEEKPNKKREAASDTANDQHQPRAKQQRVATPCEIFTNMHFLVSEDELREYCKFHGLPTHGTKTNLVIRVLLHRERKKNSEGKQSVVISELLSLFVRNADIIMQEYGLERQMGSFQNQVDHCFAVERQKQSINMISRETRPRLSLDLSSLMSPASSMVSPLGFMAYNNWLQGTPTGHPPSMTNAGGPFMGFQFPQTPHGGDPMAPWNLPFS